MKWYITKTILNGRLKFTAAIYKEIYFNQNKIQQRNAYSKNANVWNFFKKWTGEWQQTNSIQKYGQYLETVVHITAP